MVFKVRYAKESEDPNVVRAAVFGQPKRGAWNTYVWERPSGTWESTEGLDGNSYKAVLERFGLQDFSDRYPLGKVQEMNPEKLREARIWEENRLISIGYAIERLAIKSDEIEGFPNSYPRGKD